ncbi:MAG: hypothetical protein GEU94_21610 [Micromonosporaceae bacterium]|nr:hypothetical protein [Micromonosporaceae bacterium]
MVAGVRAGVVAAVVLTLSAAAGCVSPDRQGAQDRPSGTTGTTGATGTTGTGAWSVGAAAPVPLTEVGGAAFDGRVWTAGGLTKQGAGATRVLVYDPASDSWSKGPELPDGVHHAGLVGADELYLIGGYHGGLREGVTADVWVLDESEKRWRKGPPLPEARGAGAAAWDGARVVYGGGVGPDGQPSEQVYALEDGRWSQVGELSRAREHLGAASDGEGRVWFLGGRAGGIGGTLADVDLVDGDRVGRIGALPTARGGVAGFYAPGKGACLAGGEHPDGTFDEVECVAGDGATSRLPRLGHARHGVGAAVLDGTAYVLLGGRKPGLHVSAVVERLRLPEPR